MKHLQSAQAHRKGQQIGGSPSPSCRSGWHPSKEKPSRRPCHRSETPNLAACCQRSSSVRFRAANNRHESRKYSHRSASTNSGPTNCFSPTSNQQLGDLHLLPNKAS
ncbi:hypothetical protein Dimus_039443 [Dionaea muscipula]